MINNPLILKDPSGHFWEEVAEFGVGLVAQVQHDFSMGMVDELAMKPNESAAMVTGRLVGSVVSMVGGGAEATFGAATMAAGAAACGTGVLCPAGAVSYTHLTLPTTSRV